MSAALGVSLLNFPGRPSNHRLSTFNYLMSSGELAVVGPGSSRKTYKIKFIKNTKLVGPITSAVMGHVLKKRSESLHDKASGLSLAAQPRDLAVSHGCTARPYNINTASRDLSP